MRAWLFAAARPEPVHKRIRVISCNVSMSHHEKIEILGRVGTIFKPLPSPGPV
jgi:hypothetical protein